MSYQDAIVPCPSCEAAGHANNPQCTTCDGAGFVPLNQVSGADKVERLQNLCRVIAVGYTDLHAAFKSLREHMAERLDKTGEEQRTQRATANKEFANSQWEQNRMLRDELQHLARTMGLKPAKVDGHPWMPPKKDQSLLANPDASEAARGIRLVVQSELNKVLGDEAFGTEQVREYVTEALTGTMRMAVKSAIGVDSWGKFDKKSPLYTTITAMVQPHLDAATAEAVPKAIAELELPTIVDDWLKGEMRDLFVRELRHTIQEVVKGRAKALAEKAVTEEVDRIIVDEFPFLKQQLAMARLGKPGAAE